MITAASRLSLDFLKQQLSLSSYRHLGYNICCLCEDLTASFSRDKKFVTFIYLRNKFIGLDDGGKKLPQKWL
jgi:hypothetical protein